MSKHTVDDFDTTVHKYQKLEPNPPPKPNVVKANNLLFYNSNLPEPNAPDNMHLMTTVKQ